jgi:mycothiol synthase
MIRIRPYTPNDLPGFVALHNAVHPNQLTTIERLGHFVKGYNTEVDGRYYALSMWVADYDGQIVGLGRYNNLNMLYHPQKFLVDVSVHPDYECQGIGSALYDQVLTGLQPRNPLTLWADIPENNTPGLRFLAARGFHEGWRIWESHLDVTTFDPSPYSGLHEHLQAQGIEFRTYKELEHDPDRYRKLYELDKQNLADVPSPVEITLPSFERYVERTLKHTSLLHDASCVALHNGEYVGFSSMMASSGSHEIEIDTTAVNRDYRRTGIATALKLRGIGYAQAHGYTTVKTWNDTLNTAILTLNQKLGFIRQPAVLYLEKHFDPG